MTTRRNVIVHALAATTLTLMTPLGTAAAPRGDGPAPRGDGPATPTGPDPRGGGPVVTGTDDEKLVLEVTAANRVVVRLPRAEVGQGITTAVAMLLAEELDARLDDVEVPLAEARTDGGNQYTGGSSSVRTLYEPVRQLAAEARARLVTAAARQWQVPAGTLRTQDTMVIAPDGRKATFGSLTAAAAAVTHPEVPSTPKPAAAHRIVGRPAGRIDARDLVTGAAQYAGDLLVAGARPAVVARPPALGGSVATADVSAARALPGVLAVVQVPSGVAVVAETFHHAFRARDALRITWQPGPMAALTDEGLRDRLRAALPPLGPPPPGSVQVEGEFEFAFVSHAPMEVLTVVADVRAHRAELWLASQTPGDAVASVASAVGLPERAVRLTVVRAGGSFGRHLTNEAAVEAALISKAAARPVKLMWSRNDDIRHGGMRPATCHRIRASLAAGRVAALVHDVVSADELSLPLPTGAWRSVDSGMSRTAEEVITDEVAAALGKDPVAYRLATVTGTGLRAVLSKVADAGRWGRAMPAGWAQGVAVHEEYDSQVACLAEIDARDPRAPRVTAVV
ncbi:MAG TPA: molybdopterin cofactor-binding domain-containing protein, partial [Kineosporiaceae bacterium]